MGGRERTCEWQGRGTVHGGREARVVAEGVRQGPSPHLYLRAMLPVRWQPNIAADREGDDSSSPRNPMHMLIEGTAVTMRGMSSGG